MALYKRGQTWWVDIGHKGKRIQRSTGTSNKINAQRYHDKFKNDLWRIDHLDEKPKRFWYEAVLRWLEESTHKRSLRNDKLHLRWLSDYLAQCTLDEIDVDLINHIIREKKATGVANATVNRVLAVVRAILNKAANEWGWLERAPKVKLLKEDNARVRWLTPQQASKLLQELPSHLADMMRFTLATGLRSANVRGLRWENIDLENKHAWVLPEESKSKKAIAVPLNETAMDIIQSRQGIHKTHVFSYGGQNIKQCNTKAWRKALKRAGIENFRWHDLRHTWASWHVQSGTNLQELQHLGGWSDFNMVLRYAHLSSAVLRNAAERISVTKLLQLENGSV